MFYSATLATQGPLPLESTQLTHANNEPLDSLSHGHVERQTQEALAKDGSHSLLSVASMVPVGLSKGFSAQIIMLPLILMTPFHG